MADAGDIRVDTPAHLLAGRLNSIEALALLVHKMRDVNAQNAKRRTVLHVACTYGPFAEKELLVFLRKKYF